MATELGGVYREYLRALDERRWDDLGTFVHDEVVYNGQRWTRTDYRDRLVADAEAIPDLAYAVELLVVEGDHVAARLRFDCAPRGRFLGVDVDGRRVSFTEHVFYRFREGRIEQVWSHIDVEELRRQVEGTRC